MSEFRDIPKYTGLPHFGDDYKRWEQQTPPDVKNVVDSFMQVSMETKLKKEGITWNTYEASFYPSTEYDIRLQAGIKVAEQAYADFHDFMRSNGFNRTRDAAVAVALVGSSLYRPRQGSDVDVRIIFPTFDRIVFEDTEEWSSLNIVTAGMNKRLTYDAAAVSLDSDYGDIDDATIFSNWDTPRWLVMPHRIVHSKGMTDDIYEKAREKAINYTRKNIDKIEGKMKRLLR